MATALASAPDPEPGEIARHWQEADDPPRELDWRVRAALEARRRYAFTQEADHWLRVIELWPANPAEAPETIGLVGAYVAAMETLAGSSETHAAIELSEVAVATLTEATGLEKADLFSVAGALIGRVAPEAGLPLLDEAVRIYETGRPDGRLALCLNDRADVLRGRGRYDEAASAIAHAVAIMAEADDPVRLRVLLADHAWYQLASGAADTGFATLEDALARRFDDGNPHREIRFGAVHTDMLLLAGRPPDEVRSAAGPGLASAAAWRSRPRTPGT